MIRRRMTRAATMAVAAAVSLSIGTPALAASSHPRPAAKPKAAKAQHFTAHGLVVAATSRTLRVITRQLKVGGTSLPANTVVTVARPSGKGKATAAASGNLVGYAITLSGTATGSGGHLSFAASQEAAQPRPAQVFLGVVTATTDGSLQLAEISAMGGDDFGDEDHVLTVDTTAATSTVDGVTAQPQVDELAVVLGERDHDTIVAATVDGFTTPPDVVGGRISAVSGTTVTVDGGLGDDAGDSEGTRAVLARDDEDGDDTDQPGDEDQPGDDDAPAVSTDVDLAPGGTAVPIVFNGSSTVDATALTAGENILVLGESPDGTFTPTIAFVFDRHDRGPARRHHHDDRD